MAAKKKAFNARVQLRVAERERRELEMRLEEEKERKRRKNVFERKRRQKLRRRAREKRKKQKQKQRPMLLPPLSNATTLRILLDRENSSAASLSEDVDALNNPFAKALKAENEALRASVEAEREEKMALERQIEEFREQITAADDALVAAMMQNEQNQQSSPSASTPTGKQEPSRLEKPSRMRTKSHLVKPRESFNLWTV